jgi:hypothetical protein
LVEGLEVLFRPSTCHQALGSLGESRRLELTMPLAKFGYNPNHQY